MKIRLFHALALLVAFSATASAETTLTVAMTAGDIPITTGIPDQGSEGVRFVGYSLYDALVLFDKRRLGRVRLDPDVDALGPDAEEATAAEFDRLLTKGTIAVKARLLDQPPRPRVPVHGYGTVPS